MLTKALLLLTLFQSTNVLATEAIGYYSDGKLKESESIIERGTLIRKLFMQRQRFFGTSEMQNTISDAADFVRQTYPDAEVLQVGDIANKNGGACKEHASHQNGLDVDIVYLTKNGKLQSQTAPYWEEEFVINGKVSSNFFLERNLTLFKHLILTKPVGRIFVDEAIKKQFCQYAKNNNLLKDPETIETLRRIRIEKLHSTHFHLRLKCAEGDYSCKDQAEVPEGTGC
jgi:penicillin-insensitive murein endopeptidase